MNYLDKDSELITKEEQLNDNEEFLEPEDSGYHGQKSFHGRAVIKREGGGVMLFSYTRYICSATPHSIVLTEDVNYSPTTIKHVRAFLDRYGPEFMKRPEVDWQIRGKTFTKPFFQGLASIERIWEKDGDVFIRRADIEPWKATQKVNVKEYERAVAQREEYAARRRFLRELRGG